MGEIEGWAPMGGGGGGGGGSVGGSRLLPNGLLPNADPLIENLDSERWLKAEERTAELITCIQPNQPSEERRNAVADYVQRLIMKCFPCQVFTFGSVPLKTYLPDGDIDLTAFSNNPNLKDSWASEVRDLLETEEKNENAEFHVKEVQYIQAEVKIIKCLVENIVVDISFNQLGGLCTLCFLEEVDNLINQNHLFKRSIILIKAWCYYESRILGAHHGLISTYALETLVLYIFHVFNNSFAGPLEVLYRFLEFFSNFDWDNFCVSLWGPVPISSLPDVTAEPPRKDSGELLLNKMFLDACSAVYAVFPGGQDNHGGQTFLSKHFNVIDPLRVSNNLGRSVSKGNFFRIRSAFQFGAKRLARLLDCPKENLVAEVNQFFTNTWDRHGHGIRPDAPIIDSLTLKLSTDTQIIDSTNKNPESITHESELESEIITPHTQTQKIHGNSIPNKSQRNLKPGQLINDIQRSPFARTRSSPELTDTYKYIPFQGIQNKPAETQKNPNSESNSYNRNRRMTVENEKSQPPPPQQSLEALVESNIEANMHQEEQDLVNMMANSGFHGFNGQLHHMPPMNLPYPISPSFLASLGYTQRNFANNMNMPMNMNMIDPGFSGMQFPHGLVPPHITHYFPEDHVDSSSLNENNLEINSIDDNNVWRENERVNLEVSPQDEKPQASSSHGMNYVPPPRRVGGSGGLIRSQHKSNKEKRERLEQESSGSSKGNEDERATTSRFSSSLRSKTSSESSWDESLTISKSTKEKRGKKTVNLVEPLTIPDRVMQTEDNDPPTNLISDSVPNPNPPMGPMIIGSNPRQRVIDNTTPLTFYPTGPPVPFLTMLPFYNVNGSSEEASDTITDNGDIGQSQTFNPEGVDQSQSEDFSLRGANHGETPDEQNKADILNSDFASHWQNLQFGRLCQSPRQHHHGHGPMVYPSQVMVPPVYLQGGRVPWDGPGRPVPNMNVVSQLMNYGPRIVPVQSLQSVQNRPLNVYQHYVEEMPRYRSGTGTYLPNPKVTARDRHSSGPRRGNYNNYDRTDNHTDRETNWNNSNNNVNNPKPRGSNRNRHQTDKSSARLDRLGSRSEKSMNSQRHDSFSTYQSSQNGPSHPSSSQSGQPTNMTYGMYPGVPANGSAVMMVYPFEQNAGFSEQQQLEFGSFSSEQSPRSREEHNNRLYGQSGQRSSPDHQPSSPHHQRRV